MRDKYETVIGLEVHVQLKTNTKIFCSCSTTFGQPPNTQVCPICLGYPGVLPVLNEEVVSKAIKTCLMLDFKINNFNKLDRKNYFYPDLPKNYQISQFDLPVGIQGKLQITTSKGLKIINITRAHIEEDAGKLLHSSDGSQVDYNRTGVPLLEIVSEPEIHSAEEAFLYLKKLKQNLQYADISDCNMEEGSLRCDVNISMRLIGETKLGTKAEVKNINSFKFIQKAIDYEINRQVGILEEGGKIKQETRLFDSSTGKTKSMRSKEEAHDYRYFPEPDLVPIVITEKDIENIKSSLPLTPDEQFKKFVTEYNLPEYDAEVLTAEISTIRYFNECLKYCKNHKLISNWIMSELVRELNNRSVTADESPISPENLSNLINLIENGSISGKIAKDVFVQMLDTGKSATQIVSEQNLSVMADESMLEKIIKDVVSSNPETVNDFKNGKDKAAGFLVGQVMKATKGKASPQIVNTILKKVLSS